MILSSGLRKFTLTAHVATSVGLLGAVSVFLVLAVAGFTSAESEVARAAYLAMDRAARFVIVPLAVGALLGGLVQALATPWGLFRHYWVLAKLLITLVVLIVLLLQMDSIGLLADVATAKMFSSDLYREARLSLVIHASAGLLVLLVPAAMSIYKPRGMTPYGWRKQHGSGAAHQPA